MSLRAHRPPPWLCSVTLLLLLAPDGAFAQEQTPAAAPSQEFQSEYDALMKEYQEAQQLYYKAYSELETEAEREAFFADLATSPSQIFAPRFRAFAERAGTHPAAAQAWMWMLMSSGDAAEQQNGVDRLLADFLHDPVMVQPAQFIQYSVQTLGRKPVITAMRTVREKSQHATARLAATLTLGIVQIEGKSPTVRAEGRSLLEELIRTVPESEQAKRAAGQLFEMERLQIGMLAPEIEGSDSEGKAFRLSESRGQVVVLDFWGFW